MLVVSLSRCKLRNLLPTLRVSGIFLVIKLSFRVVRKEIKNAVFAPYQCIHARAYDS